MVVPCSPVILLTLSVLCPQREVSGWPHLREVSPGRRAVAETLDRLAVDEVIAGLPVSGVRS